jgi:hypothetical protein
MSEQWPHTLKANLSRPAVKPGSDWYLVPALATTASLVVGPATSLLATLTPATSVVSYEKDVDPEAVAAMPRRLAGAQHCLLTASCAFLPSADREIIVRKDWSEWVSKTGGDDMGVDRQL